LKKKQAELSGFDEELRYYADKRIEPDMDDWVIEHFILWTLNR